MDTGERSTLTPALNGPLSCRVNTHRKRTFSFGRNGSVSRAGIAAVTWRQLEVYSRLKKRIV
ncbi:MAG: hypothetical protein ACK2U3_00340 [Anaerolineales bacterium]